MKMKGNWFVWAPLAIIAFIFFITVGGYVVMTLWNWLLPPLFGWGMLTFWQALGILALSRILIGGFGFHGGPRGGMRHRRWDHDEKGSGLREWMDMTPEERERFRQEKGIKTSTSEAS